jgi:Clr5 domain
MASSGKRAADLEAYRSEIQDLYWTQDLPLAEVIMKMEQDYKVRATHVSSSSYHRYIC